MILQVDRRQTHLVITVPDLPGWERRVRSKSEVGEAVQEALHIAEMEDVHRRRAGREALHGGE